MNDTARPVSLATCAESGCLKPTTHGKPFCADHLGRLPYIASIAARLEAQRSEVDRVRRAEAIDLAKVDPRGPFAEEVIAHLRDVGPRTTDALAADLHVERFVLRVYVTALEGAGLITCHRLSKSREVVELIQQSA